MEKFYLTTAIAYASRKPHFGNTYEIIMTDAFARFQRRMGKDVFLCTGTDEHGQKIENLALEAGITPQAYVDNVAEEITHILNFINSIKNENVRDFLRIVLSSIIVKVSNQESDTRFAARNKNIEDSFVFKQFIDKAKEYLSRIAEFSERANKDVSLTLLNADSRYLTMLEDESVDIIITSPPYANTYDYYLYHKFRKRWLDIDVKYAQNNEIGSRREYSSLKKPAEQWTIDLRKCFEEMYRLLKPNSLAFIVIGDSVIKKQLIKIDEVIKGFVGEIGFEVCNVISTSLSEHSRMFNPSFTQKNKQEHLIILKK